MDFTFCGITNAATVAATTPAAATAPEFELEFPVLALAFAFAFAFVLLTRHRLTGCLDEKLRRRMPPLAQGLALG